MPTNWAPADRDMAVLSLAVGVDAFLGEPPTRWHPVAAVGRLIAAADRRAPARPLAALLYGALVALGGMLACGIAVRPLTSPAAARLPVLQITALALALKSAWAVRALEEAALAVSDALDADDLPAARCRLSALVSRDTARLDAPLVAAAAVESVAENLNDSFIAPLVWYALFGLPGAVAYRFANTCDAMLGYRGRYEYLGKAAARLDDVLNWLPARLSALAIVVAARLVGAEAGGAWRVLRADHGRTASPNAGWPMSAAAGALGVRLEKQGHYVLGHGSRPAAARTILDAVRLMRAAAAISFAASVALLLARRCHAAAA
jgi:adenosylcobinamide-phosphate synthase